MIDQSEKKIITLVGSSGSGKSHLAEDLINSISSESLGIIAGDGFHSFKSAEMKKRNDITHYSTEANEIQKLRELFKNFITNKDAFTRYYAHNEKESLQYKAEVGDFSNWLKLDPKLQTLFYEGLHGNLTALNEFVSLSIGLKPEGSLHWLQFFWREINERNKKPSDTIDRWNSRRKDYKAVIRPQLIGSNVLISSELKDKSIEKIITKGKQLPSNILNKDINEIVNDDTIKTTISIQNKPQIISEIRDLFPNDIAYSNNGTRLDIVPTCKAQIKKIILECIKIETRDKTT